jgi:hypothetical protein
MLSRGHSSVAHQLCVEIQGRDLMLVCSATIIGTLLNMKVKDETLER